MDQDGHGGWASQRLCVIMIHNPDLDTPLDSVGIPVFAYHCLTKLAELIPYLAKGAVITLWDDRRDFCWRWKSSPDGRF